MLVLNTQIKFVETDNYDVTRLYPIHALIFMNAKGMYTTKQEGETLGMVIRPPTSDCPKMKLVLLRK